MVLHLLPVRALSNKRPTNKSTSQEGRLFPYIGFRICKMTRDCTSDLSRQLTVITSQMTAIGQTGPFILIPRSSELPLTVVRQTLIEGWYLVFARVVVGSIPVAIIGVFVTLQIRSKYSCVACVDNEVVVDIRSLHSTFLGFRSS